jgi:EpsI family protein
MIQPDRSLLLFAFVVSMLTGTLALTKAAQQRAPESLAQPLETIPSELSGFKTLLSNPLREDLLSELAPTSYLSRLYQTDTRQIRLFITYYAQQKAGESMHSPRNCLPGSGWEIWKYRTANVNGPDGPVAINHYSIRKGTESLAVLYWYQTRDRIIASEYLGKFLLVRDTLTNGRTAGAVITLTVEDVPEAVEDGLKFSSQVMPHIARCLPK